MKILHLLNTNKFSGAENVVFTIIKNIGQENEMVYCSPDGPISEKAESEGIKYYPLKKLSYSEVKKVVKEFNPDIIHAHDNRASVIASRFSKKCKVISHIHGNNKIMNTFNIKSFLFNICSKKINKIIWVSDSSFDGYYFKKRVIDKSIILYNVIDEKEIVKKAELYNCNKDYDIIFLGRLGYPKNPERLIDIINLIHKVKKDISVAIVGDGPDRSLVEQKIKEYNLDDNIKLFGFQKNPYPILKKSKILIMTSIYEGTPMCALEAQSLGKPIVATPVDGLKKIIKNDYNGFLVSDNNDFVNKIMYLLDNKTYKTFSKNVESNFKKSNDVNNYYKEIMKIYSNK